MNIKKIIMVGLVAAASGAMALDYVEVTDVKARQRYPWNGLVDIDFELDSKATEPYFMKVTVFDNIGKTNLPVKTVCTEKVSQEANPCMVTKDTTRIVWNAAEDLPDGFKCPNVLVTCQDTRCGATPNLYMVVDLSSGEVSYLDSIPLGGWTDEYKKTKMVFRRIEKGSFMMGSPASEVGRSSNETRHKVTLTKAFYIGVFEVTEKQWNLVYGETGTSMKAKFATYAKIRGDDIDGYCVKTEYCYPDSNSIDNNSFIGKLKTKTGMAGFELPTEAQWEYACRAGCDTGVNIGLVCTQENVNMVARNKGNASDGRGDAASSGVTYVGCYVPNAWGLFDMLGNAFEWCRDAYTDDLGTGDATDPIGATAKVFKYPPYTNVVPSVGNGSQGIKRVVKGGVFQQSTRFAWNYYSQYTMSYTSCRASYRSYLLNGDDESGMCGFRVVCNLSE